ncbi:MAG TPA: prephenate dehydratase [Pirellulales bacterium]|jgi:chorismate mutase/prephenate dehydratase
MAKAKPSEKATKSSAAKAPAVAKASAVTKLPMGKSAAPKPDNVKPADAKPSAKGNTIAGLRLKIDRIDRALVSQMNERARLAHKIGKIKAVSGKAAYDPVREEEVLARIAAHNKGPLSTHCLQAVYREVISGSRALEKSLRVAHLGPAYTYSHLAAMQRFGQSVDYVPVASIGAVFEEVNRNHCDYGLVPIENSTDGRIADTLENFTRLPVQICGEVNLPIHHCLLGLCQRSEVQEVYSKAQPISQCRNWLARHLPQARTVEVTSTSTAAQLAKEKPGAAAIASWQAAVHYGLNLLAENIEDNQGNSTRFAVIGQHAGAKTGRDKTAIMFEVPHKPGSLADALNLFKRAKLNLTWIESFPIARPEGGYLFFVEMEGHHSDKRVQRATERLARRALRLTTLGSYAKATAPVG